MEFEKKKDELIAYLDNKVVRLKGHQDDDAYTIFTEDFETHPQLTNQDRKALIEEFKGRGDIIIN